MADWNTGKGFSEGKTDWHRPAVASAFAPRGAAPEAMLTPDRSEPQEGADLVLPLNCFPSSLTTTLEGEKFSRTAARWPWIEKEGQLAAPRQRKSSTNQC